MSHPVPTALSSTTGRGPTVKTNSQKAKKGLPHGELQRIINFQGVPNGILSCMLLSYYGLETRARKTEGPREYSRYIGSSARVERLTFLPS